MLSIRLPCPRNRFPWLFHMPIYLHLLYRPCLPLRRQAMQASPEQFLHSRFRVPAHMRSCRHRLLRLTVRPCPQEKRATLVQNLQSRFRRLFRMRICLHHPFRPCRLFRLLRPRRRQENQATVRAFRQNLLLSQARMRSCRLHRRCPLHLRHR